MQRRGRPIGWRIPYSPDEEDFHPFRAIIRAVLARPENKGLHEELCAPAKRSAGEFSLHLGFDEGTIDSSGLEGQTSNTTKIVVASGPEAGLACRGEFLEKLFALACDLNEARFHKGLILLQTAACGNRRTFSSLEAFPLTGRGDFYQLVFA